MSYLLCLQLMKALGKSTFAAVNLSTAIAARQVVEQTSGYNINNDLYYYNQTNLNMYLLTNGVATSQGVAA